MSIKLIIKGAITPERIAEVFADVAKDYATLGHNFAGAFTATIYTTAYDADGIELPNIFKDGNREDAKYFQLVPGSPLTPHVSEAGALTLQEQKKLADTEARKQVEQRAANTTHRAAERRAEAEQRRAYAAYLKELEAKLSQQESIFTALVKRFGDELIQELNNGIAEVWQGTNRTFPSGAYKGQRCPPPVFFRDENIFFIRTSPKNTIQIRTPLMKLELSSYGKAAKLRPLWQYPEWTDVALPRIVAILKKYHQRATNLPI